MQPYQYDLRCPAAKDNSITHAGATASEIAAPKADLGDSWRCENEAFLRDFLQNLKVEDVKTKLSCETSLKIWKCKMWNWSFRARLLSNSDSWRCENEAFVRDIPQKVTKMWKRSFLARLPSKPESLRCENEGFLRDFLQNLKVEDLKTKLSCETSLKDFLQIPTVEDVKRKLLRETSLKKWWRCENEAFVWDILQFPTVEDVKTKLFCETSLKKWWRCENEGFLRDFPQNLKV